jgi:hypothetical protein
MASILLSRSHDIVFFSGGQTINVYFYQNQQFTHVFRVWQLIWQCLIKHPWSTFAFNALEK